MSFRFGIWVLIYRSGWRSLLGMFDEFVRIVRVDFGVVGVSVVGVLVCVFGLGGGGFFLIRGCMLVFLLLKFLLF